MSKSRIMGLLGTILFLLAAGIMFQPTPTQYALYGTALGLTLLRTAWPWPDSAGSAIILGLGANILCIAVILL